MIFQVASGSEPVNSTHLIFIPIYPLTSDCQQDILWFIGYFFVVQLESHGKLKRKMQEDDCLENCILLLATLCLAKVSKD